jgi:SAM-dependent methyltransferase
MKEKQHDMQNATNVKRDQTQQPAQLQLARKRYFAWHIAEFYRASLQPGTKALVAGCHDPLVFERCDHVSGTVLVEARMRFELTEPHRSRWHISRESLKTFKSDERFDYVVLDDFLTYEDNLHDILPELGEVLKDDGKVFILSVNPFMLWRLRVARWLGWSTPETERNLLTLADHANLARLFGYEIIDSGYRFALPLPLLGLGPLLNVLIPRMFGLRRFCFGQFIVLRPERPFSYHMPLSCTVVVPCYNEEQNVRECIERIPDFGLWR